MINKPHTLAISTLSVILSGAIFLTSPAIATEQSSELNTTLPPTSTPAFGYSPEMTEQEEVPTPEGKKYDRWFPLLGQWAVDHGADLPSPFGVQLNYMNIRQGIKVESLKFGGLDASGVLQSDLLNEALSNPELIGSVIKDPTVLSGLSNLLNIQDFRSLLGAFGDPSSLSSVVSDILSKPYVQSSLTNLLSTVDYNELFQIDVGKTRQKSHTDLVRLDAWVLPFWNVYAVYGRTRGHSYSDVTVGSSNALLDGILKDYVGQNIDYVLDLKGSTWGLGTTFAAGYKNVFASLDFNYARTKLSVIHGAIDSWVLTPRAGYRFELPGWEKIYWPKSTLSVWLGAMYQNVKQSMSGNLSNLRFSGNLQNIVNSLNPGNASFHVEQRLKSPWNMLAGARWDIGKHFAVTTEWGFIHRNSFFVSVEGRF